jgi:hypothetical protein
LRVFSSRRSGDRHAGPVSGHTSNYSPFAVGVVLAFAGGWWLISAGHWFTGPLRLGTDAELEAIDQSVWLPPVTPEQRGERD